MHWIDPESLPAIEGKVTQWILSPSGELEGFLLDGKEQVHFPPHLSKKVSRLLEVGDTARIRALRPRQARVWAAVLIENERKGSALDDGPEKARHFPPEPPSRPMEEAGSVKMSLHGPRGELRGALLEDGVALWVEPGAAEALAEYLRPGARIRAWGKGFRGKRGRAMEVDEIALESEGAPVEEQIQAPKSASRAQKAADAATRGAKRAPSAYPSPTRADAEPTAMELGGSKRKKTETRDA